MYKNNDKMKRINYKHFPGTYMYAQQIIKWSRIYNVEYILSSVSFLLTLHQLRIVSQYCCIQD